MIARRRCAGYAIVAGLLLVPGVTALANTPPERYGLLDHRPPDSDSEIGGGDRRAIKAPVSANPLWGIPLSSLNATRERPLFRPSRRPPRPAVVAPVEHTVKHAPPTREPEPPPLRLVGIVAGADDAFAVFINSATRDIVPLKTGEGYEGWILQSVKRREAVLENGGHKVVIELPEITGEKK